MDKFRQITDGSLGDVVETLNDIIRKREDDVEDNDNLPNITVAGRKVNDIPTSSTADSSVRAGDINYTADFIYIAVEVSPGVVEWRKAALTTI